MQIQIRQLISLFPLASLVVYSVIATSDTCQFTQKWGEANKHKKDTFKEYVESGILSASLGFSVNNIPSFISAGPILPCHSIIRNVSILILGDSTSRIMIKSGCAEFGGIEERWISDEIRLRHARELSCRFPNGDIIAYLMIFGSNRVGPYHLGYANSDEDRYVDTELRVPLALLHFNYKYGHPGIVVLKTDLWDLHSVNLQASGPSWDRGEITDKSAMYSHWMNNTLSILDFIRAQLPLSYLAVQTSANIRWSLDIFFEYQNMLRLVARSRDVNTFIYDVQQLFVGIPLDSLLSDGHHPTPQYSTALFKIIYESARRWVQDCTQIT